MKKRTLFFCSAAIACAILNAGSLSAQQSGGTSAAADDLEGDGEIIVTAQRRRERLVDVPVSVSQVSAEMLSSAGIEDITSIRLAVPGTTVRLSAGYTQPYIRGVGSAAKTPLNELPIAMYMDEVYIASNYNVPNFSNVGSVEVLKGPQGTLFGRNATGGLFHVKTLDPSFTPTGRFSLGYGNYDAITTDGYFATGLSDTVAADFAFYAANQADGFGRNLFVPGENGRIYHNYGLRSKWLLLPDDDTRVVLIADYSSSRHTLGTGHVYFPGSETAPGVMAPVYSSNPFDNIDSYRPMTEAKTGGISLNVSHEFDRGFALKSITAYRADHLTLDLDIDSTEIRGTDLHSNIRNNSFSQELQAQSTGTGPFSWTAGLFYFNYKARYDPANRLMFATSTTLQDQNYSANSIAAYGQGGYALGPSTNLILGARYTWEKREIQGTLFSQTATGTTITFGPAATRQTTNDNVSFRASLDHKLAPDVMVYASFNSGFKSGGHSILNVAAYDPEKLYAYEIGLKTQFLDQRASFNIAGFYYDYKDLQVQVVTPTTGTFIQNGAAAEIYGVDADASIKLNDNWTLSGNIEWLSAKYTDFRNAPVAGRPNGGLPQRAGDATGNYLPYAPKYSANLALNHELPLGPGVLKSNLLAYFSGRYFAQPDNRESQSPYVSLNGSIQWEADAGYSIRFWMNNITDELIMQNATSSRAFVITYEPPRQYGVTIGYKF